MDNVVARSYGSTVDVENAGQFASTNALVFSGSSSRRTKKWVMYLIGGLAAATVIIGLATGLPLARGGGGYGEPPAECQEPDCDDGDSSSLLFGDDGSSSSDAKPPSSSSVRVGPRTPRCSSESDNVPSAIFQKAAVTSDSQTCSDIGSDMLKRNGSAVDAVVAAQLCLGLFVPHSTGVGGGLFMTLYDQKSRKALIIDARETAPAAATEDMFHGNSNASEKGPLAVAVPGELRGLEVAYKRYGRLPWADLLAPSIDLCFNGIEVHSALANALQEKRADIFADPGLRQVFVDPNTGDLYKQGDFYTNPQLGKTLRVISEQGVDALYKGQLGVDLVKELTSMGGIITLKDMANYTALVKEPTVANMSDGMTVYSPPPPGSGPILSNILLILDGYHFNATDLATDDADALMHHRIIEAFKFAYAKRTAMGDPDYIDMTGFVQNMTSPEYAALIRGSISDVRTYPAQYYQPEYGMKEDHGTSHLSVVAADGSAASVTSTVNLYFGAGILSQSTGIILNDEMDDFSSPNITNYFGVLPSVSNFIKPGKRPVSSMTPAILTDANGEVLSAIGAAGGTMITTATAYTIIRNLWLSENVTSATEERRIHHQLYPQYVEYETGFSEAVLEGLRKKGHVVVTSDSDAVVNPISRTVNGSWEAVSDQRKGGGVSGF